MARLERKNRQYQILLGLILILVSSPLLIYTNCGNISDVSQESVSLDPNQNDLIDPTCLQGSTACIPKVVSGALHACSLLNGNVECWGDNSRGQLGQGTVGGTFNTPQKITGLSNIVDIAAGYFHTCALMSDQHIKCWGENAGSQIGVIGNIPVPTPSLVAGIPNATQVSLGQYHSCALVAGGNIKCWGSNLTEGLLGNNSTASSYTPVKVSNINGTAISVAAGQTHTCAVMVSGNIKCWGFNYRGELGTGSNLPAYNRTPVIASIVTNSIQVTIGSEYTCSLLSNGNVKCWGINYLGQLGSPTSLAYSLTPVTVPLNNSATKITTSWAHSCAILSNGNTKCWGRNDFGQLGNGVATQITTFTVVPVSNLTGAKQISAGNNHTCAVTAGNKVKCWGENAQGQLGDGTNTDSSVPVITNTTLSCEQIIKIETGTNHTCALLNTGSMKCWGNNSSGQLGDGTIIDRLTPTQVLGLTSGVNDISVDDFSTCALLNTGSMKCWGNNSSGQLGDGTIIDRLIPTQVSGLTSGVTAISLGFGHACALLNTGSMKCWGANNSGQLGDGTNINRSLPTQVSGLLSGVSAISTGIQDTCALLNTGGMKCWGLNNVNQLGDGTTINRLLPTQVSGLTSGVSAISAGQSHTCALLNSGSMKCWGYNLSGQLGDGTTTYQSIPTQVSGLTSGVSAISAGGNETCALLNSGSMKCWGYNGFGGLGDGTNIDQLTPTQVSGLTTGVNLISAGEFYACALLNTGSMKCWGYNGAGQLGDGTIIDRWLPTTVINLP